MRSLYSKFIFFTVTIMAISFILSFLAVSTYYHYFVKPKTDEKNFQVVQSMTSYIETNDIDDLHHYLHTFSDSGYKLILINEHYEKETFGPAFRKYNLTKESMSDVLNGNEYHGMRDLPRQTFVTGFFSDETANTVGVPFTYQDQSYALFLRPNIKMLFKEIHYILAGMLFIMGIIAVFAMLYMARKLITPISALTTATKHVKNENFTVYLPTNRRDEIGQLAREFQHMTEKLSESDQMRRQFINDVSHDFQTPLQNIKGYVNLFHEERVPPEKRREYTEIIQSETTRLSTLTKQLLTVTSLDALTSSVDKKEVNIAEQLKSTIQHYRWLIDDKGISITSDIERVNIYGNDVFLEKIWENLLSNAIKYTSEGGSIDISLMKDNDQAIITCQDNGVGIKKDVLPYIFERFYREDDARHSSIKGTGLGLAIVKQVVDLHKGTIEVNSEENKGTTFIVTLPIN